MTARETGQNVGQQHFGIIVGNAQPDAADKSLVRDCSKSGSFNLQHLPGMFHQPLAILREPDAAPLLVKQMAAQLFL